MKSLLRISLVLAGVAVSLSFPVAAQKPSGKAKPAYYASLGAPKARMRTGPGRTYPATWLYVRRNLPVRVLDSYQDWRKVEDPGGTQGWVLGTLVSSGRTAIVTGDGPAELRDVPAGPKLLWRAAPGVVGRISRCGAGWCRFDVNGQIGFVEVRRLWGVDDNETLP